MTMAATEPIARLRHVDLPTQQRRLRHLRSIAVRNFHPLSTSGNVDITQLDVFFTLHLTKDSKAIYTSEKIKGSLNPTWKSFYLEHMSSESVEMSSNDTVVRIWVIVEQAVKLCIEWEVNLCGLTYLGDQLQREGINFPNNGLLFGVLDGYYGAMSCPKVWDDASCKAEVDQAMVRNSYSVQTLLRIQTIVRAIKQTQASVQQVKQSIEDRLLQSRQLQTKNSKRELHLHGNMLMCSDLTWRTLKLQGQKESCETLQTQTHHREMTLRGRYETLQRDKTRLHEKKKSYFDVREILIKTGAQLVMRRKQLISELAIVYPIVELPSHEFTISGVLLPNSEDFAGRDDTSIAVALGYTAHLIQMISQILDVPLRYPMDHQGSRSQIRDHIIDKLLDKERDFPLFTKGKERFQFSYGVYLLNKNISQLRYYCGLGTTDLRPTLTNLKSLLELRLGVIFESSNAPVLAGQHMSIPPNLGGPQQMTSPSFPSRPTARTAAQHVQEAAPPCGSRVTSVSSPGSSTLSSPERCQNALLPSADQRAASLAGNDVGGGTPFPGASTNECSFRVGELTGRACTPEGAGVEPGHTAGLTDGHSVIQSSPGNSGSDHLRRGFTVGGTEAGAAPVDNCGPHGGTICTLDELSQEKLLGSIANYDDIEVSSSEDSACAVYNSRFKMWPQDQRDEFVTGVDHTADRLYSDHSPDRRQRALLVATARPSDAGSEGTSHGVGRYQGQAAGMAAAGLRLDMATKPTLGLLEDYDEIGSEPMEDFLEGGQCEPLGPDTNSAPHSADSFPEDFATFVIPSGCQSEARAGTSS